MGDQLRPYVGLSVRPVFERAMRRIVLQIAICASIALVVVGAYRHFRIGRFSHVNFDRIKPGMTVTEVEVLLGSPGIEERYPNGERFFNWSHSYDNWIESATHHIRVKLKDDKVVEADYREPPFVFGF